MNGVYDIWWLWLIAAGSLAILELLAPAYIFLGFAIGAGIIGVLLLISPWLASLSLPFLLLIFSVLSLVAWAVLRQVLGVRKDQVKIWDRDINEN